MERQIKSCWNNSIRLKLLMMMIITSFIPLLFLGYYNIGIAKKEVEGSIHRQHALTTVRVSHSVSDLVKTLRLSLETISISNPDVFNGGDIKKQENLIYSLLKRFPHLEEIAMISASGEEIVKVSKRYTVSKKELEVISNDPGFQKLRQGEFFIGRPELDIENQMVFSLGIPVGGIHNSFKGAIIAKISLRQVMQEIASVEIADGSYVMLIDKEGSLIGHSDYSQVLRKQNVLDSRGVRELLRNRAEETLSNTFSSQEFKAITYKSYTGEDVLGVYGTIPTVDWGVVVEQPIENSYGTLRDMLFRLNLMLVIIVAITVFGGFYIFYLIQPVSELAKGVASVKIGNLDYQIPKRNNDELGLVIEAFNEMIKEIKKKRINEQLVIQAEKSAAIGTLAAGVAHEINNPMNNLGFYAADLLDRLESEDINRLYSDGVIQNYLEIIDEQIRRCAGITQSLLNFSREKKVEIGSVNIKKVIKETLNLTEHLLRKQNIDVIWDDKGFVPPILADESQMQQMVLNLITNAIDAMESGGTLRIKIDNNIKENNYIMLKIIDTGIGIPEEIMARIFDPFYTTKPVGKGTGLGLAISQAIVERIRGNISIFSECNRGTEVTVKLPTEIEVIEDGTV